MKKNFYKEYMKNREISKRYKENENIIVENLDLKIKVLHCLISFINRLMKILVFCLFLILLSTGSTVIFNVIFHTDLINISLR